MWRMAEEKNETKKLINFSLDRTLKTSTPKQWAIFALRKRKTISFNSFVSARFEFFISPT